MVNNNNIQKKEKQSSNINNNDIIKEVNVDLNDIKKSELFSFGQKEILNKNDNKQKESINITNKDKSNNNLNKNNSKYNYENPFTCVINNKNYMAISIKKMKINLTIF